MAVKIKKKVKKKVVKKKVVKKKVVKKKVKVKSQKSGEVKTISRKPGTNGHLIISLIKQRLTNAAIVPKVLEKFPESAVSVTSVAWYRNKLRQTMKSIPTNRDLVRAQGKKK